MRYLFALLAALTLHAQVSAIPADDRAEVALQAAIRTETVDGDLQAAIRQYEAVTQMGDRKTAAQALLRMARCYQKLGSSQSQAVFERVVREFGDQKDALREAQRNLPQTALGEDVGWYNGDWCHCARGLRNQIIPDGRTAFVYEDFIVPRGGWTITGVFSNNSMDKPEIKQAYWEIRSGMVEGYGGVLLASKTSPARANRRTQITPDGQAEYEVRVDGLNLKLEPGLYWLTVAPVADGLSYVHPTEGRNGVGSPSGNDSQCYWNFQDQHFVRTEVAMPGFHDSSQGVRIARKEN
jgi:hypothetical protein